MKIFPGPNELRAIAALSVLMPHIEQFKVVYGFKEYTPNPIIFHISHLAVTFFFVLSGFLVTYRLLAEKEATGTVSVKDFRLRRGLRILPLYFLIVFLSFFVLPNVKSLTEPLVSGNFFENIEKYYWGKFGLYLLILPNIAYILPGMMVPYIVQAATSL